MIIPIPSNGQRFRLRIGIRAFQPLSLVVKGYDTEHANSYYFRRRVPFKPSLFKNELNGYKEFSIPMPLSPKLLIVELYNRAYGDDEDFIIEKFEVEKLEPSEVWAEPEIHRFIQFAQSFAEKAGYLRTGFYDSKSKDFLIEYLPVIKDQNGYPLITPARTNRLTGRIQVSRMHFEKYSIPIRIFILLHERFHFQIPTRKERPADLAALKIFLDLGFPETEAIYAATKIFLDHSISTSKKHANRVKDIHRFVDDYILKNEQGMQLRKAS